MRIGPGSQVAKALLCKRSIRECKSRPGLQNLAGVVELPDTKDLKSFERNLVRVGLPPPAP